MDVLQVGVTLRKPTKDYKLKREELSLSSDRACLGRVYFHVAGGIQVGQHWLDIRFAGSTVQVPFRTLTKEEEKEFSKSTDFRRSVNAAVQFSVNTESQKVPAPTPARS